MKIWMPAAALAGVIAAAAPAAFAQAVPPPAADSAFRATILSLSAFGETRAAPDMATITLGVTTDAAQASEAVAANARQMAQVLAALKRGGVAERDIQTSQLSLDPQYLYQERLPPKLTGYRATNQVSVRVRDLSRLGQAVDAVVGAGANQLGGISFGLSDPSAAEDAARREAVKALQAKADLYGQATGYRVLRLVSLTEGAALAPSPPVPMAVMASARFDKAETQVSPGEMRVRIDVSAVFELGR
jgi:uncharacterized protein YggE